MMLNAETLLAMPHDTMVDTIKKWTIPKAAQSRDWPFWQRADQAEPLGNWRIWLVMAGRGYGKTRMGAEWVRAQAMAYPGARIALIGATLNEARAVMVEGESGLLSLPYTDTPQWEPSLRKISWPNGSIATLYSAAEPDSLRGGQHHFAWGDEIAKWGHGIAAWDNLMLGLRLGFAPKAIATTTPRPVPLLKRLLNERAVAISNGRTTDNIANLAPEFISNVQSLYGGTRLGRQELNGELIEDIEGALWTRALLERQRVVNPPLCKRIFIGVDPPISAHGDACGIIAVGLGMDDKAYVLGDHSVRGKSPEGWARAVAAAVEIWDADRVIAEGNQGGNMVESILRAADINMPVRMVHASKNKSARAEPIAALYEAGRAYHAGTFPELEDELCGMVAGGGYAGAGRSPGVYNGSGRSPDRVDAMVWAMDALILARRGMLPGVRVV